jgi:carboxymethylenebutenolidase
VIHENRGLNAHIEDVARRAALEGFAGVAPDLLSPQGGTPKDEDHLGGRGDSGKLGSIGFCWGGGRANQLAVHSDKLAAASPFYGELPDALDVPRIRARLLLHYAERDPRINTGVPAYEGALKAADDTAGARYNKEAAELAWQRTMAFLKDALK